MKEIFGAKGIRRNHPFTSSFVGLLILFLIMFFLKQSIEHVNIKWNSIYSHVTSQFPNFISFKELILKGHVLQNDPLLVQIILKEGYLQMPAESNVSYNLTNPTEDPSLGQSDIIRKIFKNKTNGFFVESGALDGETRSNTLSLEKDLGWKGLLIEPDPVNFINLQLKRRKAWLSPSCLSIHPYPHKAILLLSESTSKIVADYEDPKLIRKQDSSPDLHSALHENSNITGVQCFPLFSLLTALNVATVDYLSLDVEGSEIDVLKTIPFHLITIQVLSVEITHGVYRRGTANYLKDFMNSKGFTCVTRIMHPDSYANDLVFASKSFRFDAKFAPEILHWNSTLTFDIV